MWQLSRGELLSFASGTVLSDLAAACWFTYLLIYLEDTLDFSPGEAGAVLLVGQVADAIATPFVGLISDHSSSQSLFSGWRLCRRTYWHLIGTCLIVIFYACIWTVKISCKNSWDVVYYSVGAAMFNVGWAAVQVSHLALTGDLSANEHCRTRINSARFSFSIASALVVFLSYLLFIDVVEPIGEMSMSKYRYVSIVVLVIGIAASVIFHVRMHYITVKKEQEEDGLYESLNVEECLPMESNSEGISAMVESDDSSITSSGVVSGQQSDGDVDDVVDDGNNQSEQIQDWKDWFHEIRFYIVGSIYVLSRCASNIIMVYMSFFLIKTLEMEEISIALVPATMYFSSVFTTLCLEKFTKLLGRNQSFVVGAAVIILGSTSCVFLDTSIMPVKNLVYISAIMLGTGTAIATVGSVTLITDLVGDNLKWGAFVYGSISFVDKLTCGLLVIIVQLHRSSVCLAEDDEPDSEECRDFVRLVISAIPLLSMFVAIICLYILTNVQPLARHPISSITDSPTIVSMT